MNAKREKVLAGESGECEVCGLKLSAHVAAVTREYLGDVYTFCSEACAATFGEDPERFEASEDDDEI